MAYVLPIPLPASLVTERRVVAKHDFTHAHHTVAFGPDGRGYVHSELFYNYFRYGQGDEDLAAQIVTLLSHDFSITKQVWLEDLHAEMTHQPGRDGKPEYVFNNAIAPLAVTAHHEVVFTTQQNRTFVYDADLDERVARFDPLVGEGAGFSDVVAVPGGLVCVRDRDRIGVVTTPAPFADWLPSVRDVASAAAVVGELGVRGYLGRFAALDLDRILVTQFTSRGRSGWVDHAAFAYVVIDGDGAVVGRFPLGAADTPYGKHGPHDDSYVAHPGLGAWLVRSDAALHVFDRDGARALRIGLAEDERFAAIVPLTLSSIGPAGELVMVSKKHHLLVVTDPIDGIGAIESVLAEAGAVYASELARLKKAVPYANGRWFGWEPRTPRAAVRATKAKKAGPAKEAVVDEAPAVVAATPAEAVSLAPHDIDTLSVYADSLAATDAALGDYINTSIRAHRMSDDDPERAALVERARGLFQAHGERWLRAWNEPRKLFGERFFAFGGLPCSVALEELGDPAALDRQVIGLPIQTLSLSGLGMRDIAKLHGLPLLRRITQLIVSGDSRRKLGKPLLAWLVAQQLAGLESLHLHAVAATGAGLREVVESMPALQALVTTSAGMSAESIEVLAATAGAARLDRLGLDYNPLGGSATALFARFPRLQTLELNSTDLGDEVAALPPAHITASKLEIDNNPRLGAAGLAWLVRAMPALRELRMPRDLDGDALPALAPLAGRLATLDASWTSAETKEQLVAQLIPQARALRRLVLTGHGDGFAPRILAHTTLDHLELGDVTDDDIAALANAQTIRELYVGEGATDASLGALAGTAKLAALETLHVHSHGLTEAGIARLLAAAWPKFTRLELMYAHIRDAGTILAPRDRPFTLRLFMCDVPRRTLDQLRLDWGDRLIA